MVHSAKADARPISAGRINLPWQPAYSCQPPKLHPPAPCAIPPRQGTTRRPKSAAAAERTNRKRLDYKEVLLKHPQGTAASAIAKSQAQLRAEILGPSLQRLAKQDVNLSLPDFGSSLRSRGLSDSTLILRSRSGSANVQGGGGGARARSSTCNSLNSALADIQEKKQELGDDPTVLEGKLATLNDNSVAEPEEWLQRALRQDDLDPLLRSRAVFALANRLARRKAKGVNKHANEAIDFETNLLQDREYLFCDPFIALEMAYVCRDGLGLETMMDTLFLDLERHALSAAKVDEVPEAARSPPRSPLLSPKQRLMASKFHKVTASAIIQRRMTAEKAEAARKHILEQARRADLLAAEGVEDTPRFQEIVDGITTMEKSLAQVSSKQWLKTLDKHHPYRHIFVDIAEWRRQRGDMEKCRLLMECARAVPGDERDPRTVSRFYSWRFASSPEVPQGNFRVQVSAPARHPVKRALSKCSHGCTRELYGISPCVGHPGATDASEIASGDGTPSRTTDETSPRSALGATLQESMYFLESALDEEVEVDEEAGTNKNTSANDEGSSNQRSSSWESESQLACTREVPVHMRQVIDRTFNIAPGFVGITLPSHDGIRRKAMDEQEARLEKVNKAASRIVAGRRFRIRILEEAPSLVVDAKDCEDDSD